MALGAQPGGVVRLVVRQMLGIGGVSVVAAVFAALVFARLLSSQLYGITPTDRAAFLAAPVIVVLVTVCAAWLPARRAARVDPLIALRAE